ncbi:peroxin [Malassezia caprae]|uniref:Peroxin n=1 Tax=Malassezia caprae TaxID=1381934 RepID=A0AAF0E865_9BASI|nr:peroxin [Malassezia caprae]
MALSQGRRKWLRRGVSVAAVATSVVGGLYLLAQFALTKFNDIQERLLRDRVARENLRRRFLQNQEDCSFTIMALLPTLSSQIFEAMDVESISQALLAQNRRRKGTAEAAAPPAEERAHDTAEENAQTGEAPTSLESVSEPAPKPPAPTARLPAVPTEEAPTPESEEERRATKLRLWDEIKHISFERTLTSLYTLVFLSLQTYIQLNMLGRRAYLAALENQAKRDALARSQKGAAASQEPHQIALLGDGRDVAPDAEALDDLNLAEGRLSQDTEKKYLTSSYWFLHHGWKTVADRVREAVHAELGDMPVKTLLTYEHVQALIGRLRAHLEGDAANKSIVWQSNDGFHNILLPESAADEVRMLREAGALAADDDEQEALTPQLRDLLDETKDYIDSPDFAQVFQSSCEQVFALFLQKLGPGFGAPSTDPRRPDKPLLLAKVLPFVSQQAKVALTSTPNDYVDAIVEGRDLRALSVLIYSAWDDELDRDW